MVHKIVIKGKGQLRHRFHGEYSAVVAIDFGAADSATLALGVLGKPWEVSRSPNALVCVVSTEELEVLTERLGTFGADTKKVASLAKSIDFGEPFEVSIEVENQDQLSLV